MTERRGRSWWLAGLVSLLAHGAAGVLLWSAPGWDVAPREAPDAGAGDLCFTDFDNPPAEVPSVDLPSQSVLSGSFDDVPWQPPSADAGGAGQVIPAGGSAVSSAPGITFFEVSAQGRSVVYVVDRSASMGPGGRFARARQELLASLERLPTATRFQVIAYNSRADVLRFTSDAGLLPATAENKKRTACFLDTLECEGGTQHFEALKKAVLLGADVVYFLTDADDLRADEVNTLTLLNGGRSSIHAIEMDLSHRARPDMPMQVLARANRGTYRAVR